MIFILPILGLAVVVFGLMIFVQKKTDKVDKQFFSSKWDDISKMYQNSENRYVEAIIEGDKLLDEALKQRKYEGRTMGERMVSANRTFKDPDMVWNSHKLRNKIVHETNIKVTKKHASYALRGFRKGLKDLEVL